MAGRRRRRRAPLIWLADGGAGELRRGCRRLGQGSPCQSCPICCPMEHHLHRPNLSGDLDDRLYGNRMIDVLHSTLISCKAQ